MSVISRFLSGAVIMKYAFLYDSPAGRLWIAEENGAITDIRYGPVHDAEVLETPLLRSAFEQLSAYFNGSRRLFDLPLNAAGTAFQKSVWQALLNIPYGETRSYSDIARAVGNVRACRAVGMANNKNPIAVIIPCHRVIGADGRLAGYSGGLDIKRLLLELEKKCK